MSVAANNTVHLQVTTLVNGTTIVPPESLDHVPPGVQDTLNLVRNNTSAIYVYEPLPAGQDPAGQDRIDILLNNLRSSSIDPTSITFEDIAFSWFSDLLLGRDHATHETRVDNQIFQAYGLVPYKTVPPSLFPLRTHALILQMANGFTV